MEDANDTEEGVHQLKTTVHPILQQLPIKVPGSKSQEINQYRFF